MDANEIVDRFNAHPTPALTTLGGGVAAYDSETERLTMRWTATRDHCHSIEGHPRGGIVQGGFITGWLDSAMAHACIAKSRFKIAIPTLEIKVSFLRPVHPGPYRSIGWITRWGRRIAFTEAELRNEADEVVARASSTAAISPMSEAGQSK